MLRELTLLQTSPQPSGQARGRKFSTSKLADSLIITNLDFHNKIHHINIMDALPLPPLSAQDSARLQEKLGHLDELHDYMTGYPCSQLFDYEMLYPMLQHMANNVGDPWANSNYGLNTLDFEREVLSQWAEWLKADSENFWGYVTSGGTEGNMHGLYVARELHKDGIVYYSEDTHYSVTKIIHVLGMRSIMIRSQENGEMDYEDLRESIKIHRDVPPIIFANIGTTMKQAIDSLPKIKSILKDLAISEYYLHSDAAFPGSYLPFIENRPEFDFSHGIDSISISGHKFIGSPVPCGMVLAKRDNIQRIGRRIEYIGAMDTTIPGSRSAVTPMVLWVAMKRWGAEGFKELANHCLEKAQYLVDNLQAEGVPAWRNDHGITVVMPRPSDEMLRRWSMAPEHDIAHVITTGHVTPEILDRLSVELLEDYRNHQRNFIAGDAA
jgi:histidine decarboxylase